MLRDKRKIVSHSEAETRKIAKDIISPYLGKDIVRPVVILLYGDLGTGKTVFVKEIGKILGIDDIISPAFIVYYEYPLEIIGFNYLYHFDLYRITEPEEFDHLGIKDVLQPGNVICIEWSEKSGPIMDLLKNRAEIISVKIEHVNKSTRKIITSCG